MRQGIGGTAYIEDVGQIGSYPSIAQARDAIKIANARAGRTERNGWVEAADGRVIPVRSRHFRERGGADGGGGK